MPYDYNPTEDDWWPSAYVALRRGFVFGSVVAALGYMARVANSLDRLSSMARIACEARHGPCLIN
jgi:hypothetical protein